MTVHQLLQALVDGEKSRLLGELHMGMLRIVQADMEEAHATGAMQVRSLAGTNPCCICPQVARLKTESLGIIYSSNLQISSSSMLIIQI